MSALNNSLLLGQEGGGGYAISRSLRFNSSDSAYLSRTPASAGNRKTWTWAGWVKRSALSTASIQSLFITRGSPSSSATWFDLYFTTADKLYIGNFDYQLRVTNQVFRDTSAWYHIVVACDTTQATAANRLKLYVNGTQVSDFTLQNDLGLNEETGVSNAVPHYIGSISGTNSYLSAYLADIHFIDGQALTPTSFGAFSATTGVWMPKAYSGTYGTNGFHLDFSNNASAAALGTDTSGNGNTWTVNNLSVTAGAGNDSLRDSPTNGTASTGGDAGGVTVGNYCTWNPTDISNPSNLSTFSNGNLDCTIATLNSSIICGTIAVTSGKWYWEIDYTNNGGGGSSYAFGVGVGDYDLPILERRYAGGAGGWVYYASNGDKWNNGTNTSYGSAWAVGDTIGIALDMDNGTLTFYKNGTSQGTAFSSGLTGKRLGPTAMNFTGSVTQSITANFGQRPFARSGGAPSGFKALCTANLPAPVVTKPSTVFDVKLYTGNGSTQTISGLNMSPDLVWIKNRTSAYNHGLWDTVRGATNALYSSLTNAEGTESGVSAFNSDGFSVGSALGYNKSSDALVAWCWDAGSSTVTDNTGSIQSSRRTNASAGFSVVTYSLGGGSSTLDTVGHGLGVTPALVICKNRDTADNWYVGMPIFANPARNVLVLNNTASLYTLSSDSFSFSSTTVGIRQNMIGSASGQKAVVYCWAPVAGYSSFGSYTGNGSADGPFVYTGFRPRWILIKISSSADQWCVFDSARDGFNGNNDSLYPNNSQVENNYVLSTELDILSNGFKPVAARNQINASSATFIWAAFAELPFNYARAR